jgi:hypothetical protein
LICYGVSVEVSSTEVEVLGAAAIQIDTWSNALVVKLILSDIATYSSSLNVISSSALDCTHETNHPPSVSIYLPLASDIERPSSCTGIGVGSGHLQRERERERIESTHGSPGHANGLRVSQSASSYPGTGNLTAENQNRCRGMHVPDGIENDGP